MYKLAFDGATDGMFIIEDGKFIECNEAALKMFAYTDKQKMLDTHPSELSPDYQPSGEKSFEFANEKMQTAIEKGENTFEWVHCRANGDPFWVEVVLRNISTSDTTMILVNERDINDRKIMEKKQQDDYESMLKSSKSAIAIIDMESNFLDCNDLYLDMIGFTRAELLKRSCINTTIPKDIQRSISIVKKVIKEGFVFGYKKSCIRQNGDIIDLEMSLFVMPDRKRILISAKEITKQNFTEKALIESRKTLEQRANFDYLTNLPNRTLFQDRLEQAAFNSKRKNTKFALLFIDIDKFKQVNDAHGHRVGDAFLIGIAKKISKVLRDSDTLARIGGDEFAIIMNDVNDSNSVGYLIKRIFTILDSNIVIEEIKLKASLSIGISIFPNDTQSADELLTFSDLAMYHAKKSGNNDFAFYNEEMNEEVLNHLAIEKDLIQAIENEEFVVYFQPQIDANTDTLLGMEALVRWQHPTKGLLFPDTFIPIAESTGLIVGLDRCVMKTAMKQFSSWYEQGCKPGKLSLNLAIKQIQEDGCIHIIQHIMQVTKFLPEWLEFEITESDLLTEPEKAMETLKKIRQLGIGLSIDDFGTGYSSLSYLKKFPITKLKIDQSFIRDLESNADDQVIVKSIIALANALGLDMIAEGVETSNQKDILIQNECSHMQGYFFSKPVPVDEIEFFFRIK